MSIAEKVPFTDLKIQWHQIRKNVLPELDELFDQSAFCLGPWVERFELAVAEYLGVRHAVAVNSGTSALHLAVIASNIKPGDKVLVPAQTFIGTIWGLLYEGITPVLCDVDKETATISIDEIKRHYDDQVKAIIPVHLFGQPANMEAICDFADQHQLTVIEDAAQAFGAKYKSKKVGNVGKISCVSFYPGKNLGAAGEAGLITTNDDRVADRLRTLRNHGQKERYVHDDIGFNYRMTGIQGLILSHKLKHIDDWNEQRRLIATKYQQELSNLPLTLPRVENEDHIWHLFVIQSNQRDALRSFLTTNGIETGLHYPIPLNRQPILSQYSDNSSAYPNAEMWANYGLSLPIFPGMTVKQQDRVIACIKDFFNQR